MTRFHESLLNVSLFLTTVITLVQAKIAVNRCKSSSTAGSCEQECGKDCKMLCARTEPPLKSCDQACLDGQCDMRCVTKEMCHQNCESPLNCGKVFCKTANCTQLCDVGTCDLSCRASSHCKQSCNQGSCNLKCPKTGEHCKQVSLRSFFFSFLMACSRKAPPLPFSPILHLLSECTELVYRVSLCSVFSVSFSFACFFFFCFGSV